MQKQKKGNTFRRVLWLIGSVALIAAARYYWSLPEGSSLSNSNLETSEQIEEVARTYSRSSSLSTVLYIAGVYSARQAVKGLNKKQSKN